MFGKAIYFLEECFDRFDWWLVCLKRCWRTDRNGKREQPRLYRRSRLNLKVVGGACNCCRFAKMIKIQSFRATTSELLRSSFAGSISQQPAPISIYPDMDRMMHRLARAWVHKMQFFYNGLVDSQQLATNWIDNTVAAYVEDAAPAALGGFGPLWAAMSSLGCSGLALLALGWL